MTSNQAEVKLQKAYAKAGGTNGALPWAEILQAILSLLGVCTAKSAKEFGRNHPAALQLMLQNKLRDDLPDVTRKDRVLVAQAGVAAFNAASLADIGSFTP